MGSFSLYLLASEIMACLEVNQTDLKARFIPGKIYVLADWLNHKDQAIGT